MSPEFRAGERVEVVTHPCCECGEDSNCYAQFRDGDFMCQICCDKEMDLDAALADAFEDDGQPTEYEEWQDFMGGDDWDHGQYDDVGYYDE